MDCTEYIITNKRFFKGPREEKLKSLEGLIKRKVKVISYCVRNYHKTVAFFFSFLFFFFGLACRILILRPETNPHPKWKQSPSHWNIKEFPKPNALKQNFIMCVSDLQRIQLKQFHLCSVWFSWAHSYVSGPSWDEEWPR